MWQVTYEREYSTPKELTFNATDFLDAVRKAPIAISLLDGVPEHLATIVKLERL